MRKKRKHTNLIQQQYVQSYWHALIHTLRQQGASETTLMYVTEEFIINAISQGRTVPDAVYQLREKISSDSN